MYCIARARGESKQIFLKEKKMGVSTFSSWFENGHNLRIKKLFIRGGHSSLSNIIRKFGGHAQDISNSWNEDNKTLTSARCYNNNNYSSSSRQKISKIL